MMTIKNAAQTLLLISGLALSTLGQAAIKAAPLKKANASGSDLRLAALIKRDVLKDEEIKATLKVQAHQGTVTLAGTAQNLFSKKKAVEIASTEAGVKHVVDKIKVAASEAGAKLPSDSQMNQRIRTLFAYDSFLGPYELSSSVSHGHVKIKGALPSAFHKQRAEELAARVTGVSAVSNLVTIAAVKPAQSDAVVAKSIQERLTKNSMTGARKLSVTVNQGVANISGNVKNWQEAKIASQLAYDGGAKIVRNFVVVKDTTNPNVNLPATATATTNPSNTGAR